MALLITHPKLLALFAFWNRLRGGRPMPSRDDFDVFDVREWLGHLHLVEVLENGRDFRHLIYGTELAVSFGVDLTGKTPATLPPATRDSLLEAYRAVVTRRQPLVLDADPVLKSTVSRVEDLLLPLSSDGSRVDRLLIGAYPVENDAASLPTPFERRAEPRVAVLLSGAVTAADRRWSCIVMDCSPSGARLEFHEPVALAARVQLHVEGRRLAASVAWQRDRRAGLRFADRLRVPLC